MSVPSDRRYLKSHEWHKLEGDVVTIGITKFAADELTDITYVSLPPVGKDLAAGKPFGEIESVKATSDLYAGVSGKVVAINDQLANHPELVNNDPFNTGWMIKIKPSDAAQINNLLDAAKYDATTGQH